MRISKFTYRARYLGLVLLAGVSLVSATVSDGTEPVLQAASGNLTLGDLTGGTVINNVIWRTNGLDRARFDNGGRLLLNTTAADAQLHVRTADFKGIVLSTSNTDSHVMLSGRPAGTGYFTFNSNGGQGGFIFGTGSPDLNGAGTELMKLQNNGILTVTGAGKISGALDIGARLTVNTISDQVQLQSYDQTTKTWRLGTYIGASGANRNFTLWESDLGNAFTISQGTGAMGIGTVAPSAKLHVNAANHEVLKLSTSNANADVVIEGNPTSSGNFVLLSKGGAKGFSFQTPNSTGASMELMHLANNGYATITGSLSLSGNNQFIGSAYGTSYNDFWRVRMDGQSTDAGALHIQTGDNGDEPIYFEQLNGDSRNVRMAVAANGNVGIGIGEAAPQANLHVGGSARVDGALQVKTWTVAPDYVFDKDYKLASLEEVDAFVKKNRHLPEVPSAKEFKEKGMDLAEMNFTLLKKVEELTLHAIKQNQEILKQNKEIAGLKKTVVKLVTREGVR